MDCVWSPNIQFEVPTETFVNCLRYVLLEDMHKELLAAGTDDGDVILLDLTVSHTAPPATRFACGSAVLCVDVIGCLIVAGTHNGRVVVWNYESGSKVSEMPHTAAVRSIVLWEGPPELAHLESEAAALYVFSTAEDFVVKLWRVDVRANEYSLSAVFVSSYVGVRCVSLDGKRVIASVGKFLHCWEYEDATKRTYNWLTQKVFLREHAFVAKCLEEPGPWKVKTKHLTACDGLEIGTVTNHSDGNMEHTGNVIDVDFPVFKNVGRWPTKAFGVCVAPKLMWRAHDVGQIYAVCGVREGMLVTGDEKGTMKVWRWSETDALYAPIHTVEAAHTDVIQSIHVLRAPDVFLTFGYDGKGKQWRLVEDFLRCQRVVTIDERFPVMCSDVFQPGLCVFTVLQFHRDVQCWYLLPVATCALPDDMVFDEMSALFNFESFLYVILLTICTATYSKSFRPTAFQRDSPEMYRKFLYKCSVLGDRLSPWISVCCGLMALRILFFV